MNLIIREIEEKYPEWNRRHLTENDFYQFCAENGIEVIEIPLRYRVKAILWFVENEYVITVNADLYGTQKLLAMWHEIGHFLLHSPNRTIGTYFWGDEKIYSHQSQREENQADFFSLCASIPNDWVLNRKYNELLEEGFTERQLQKRKEIYEKYRI